MAAGGDRMGTLFSLYVIHRIVATRSGGDSYKAFVVRSIDARYS